MASFGSFSFGEVVPRLKAGESVDGIVPLTQTPDSWVYRLQKGQRPCILRISTPAFEREDGRTSAEGIARRIETLKRGQGLKGFEQLIDHSMQHEAVLTHEAPGKPLPELTTPEVQTIRPKHLKAVARAIGKGVLRGIGLDTHPTNMIFHSRHGITIIDYGLANEGQPVAQEEYAQFLAAIGGHIVTPKAATDYRAAWSRAFEDGLAVFRQTFGTEPGMILPDLVSYQRMLRE